ncbi:hypothetical protein [Listeria fleischmannii]|uniref:hypothetical protein n=1 Tax=Listeria fleischmannii TaxID=1069827 RepID=UPI001626D6AA|nr:hypothetical protein [Listeria fleischmannii]MBC1420119.1 hypothetical protein [Listeria fleischmannii]
MAEIRIHGVSEELKSHYKELAEDKKMSLSAYLLLLLKKNYFTQEIEQRENKFYEVIESLEKILLRQTEVTENFHHDLEIFISKIIEEGVGK